MCSLLFRFCFCLTSKVFFLGTVLTHAEVHRVLCHLSKQIKTNFCYYYVLKLEDELYFVVFKLKFGQLTYINSAFLNSLIMFRNKNCNITKLKNKSNRFSDLVKYEKSKRPLIVFKLIQLFFWKLLFLLKYLYYFSKCICHLWIW